MRQVPHIPKDIMDYLLGLYPDRSPDIATSDRMIWVKHGEIQVVRHLKSLFDAQQERQLGETTTHVLRRGRLDASDRSSASTTARTS